MEVEIGVHTLENVLVLFSTTKHIPNSNALFFTTNYIPNSTPTNR